MNRRFIAAARIACMLFAAAAAAPAAAQPRSEQAAIDFAAERGRLLYAIDRAAWVATDDLQLKMRNWQTAGMSGFVVDRDGSAFQVLFYGGPAEAPVAFYRARVANHRVVSSEVFPADARPALTPLQRRLASARAAVAEANRRRPCGRAPFNVAIIPPATPDSPVDVYLMTPQEQHGVYPFGGHYRVTVAADGTLSGERAFTNSCLTMRSEPPRRGSAPAAMGISHLLDPVPTEIHVFTSLAARLPVFVAIVEPPRLYEVAGDRIRLVESEAPAPRK